MQENSQGIGNLLEQLGKSLSEIGDPDAYVGAIERLSTKSTQLNKIFLQNRQRIEEMKYAIADAVPGVERLGGSIEDVTKTIGDIALASRRNVIANTESVEKMYAAFKVLGTNVETLTTAFAEIGFTFDKIPKQLESSISYIQSIGGNAKEVMGSVLDNADKINRFQFEGGVQGLTKMAAQASMMRFDMYNTFSLAEQVMSPDKAVEVASAFQRLGVAAGNLVDPFQLMNQSINDPQGLQDSLINVGKQFAEFDKESGQFKIGPEGVMRLKEIEAQTGVSSKELMKAGLAAKELDARLSSIKPEIKFANEEDKQYLANIASMEDGEYTVKLKDERGDEYSKRLADVNQEEMEKLIKEQKEGEKPLEEIARDQMSLTELITNDVSAIKNKILYGVGSTNVISKGTEGIRRQADVLGGTISQTGQGFFDVKDIRGQFNEFYKGIESIFKEKKGEDLDKALDEYLEKSGDKLGELGTSVIEGLEKYVTQVKEKTGTETWGEQEIKELLGELEGQLGTQTIEELKKIPLGSSFIEGSQSLTSQVQDVNKVNMSADGYKVEFDGDLNLNLKLPPEFAKLNDKDLTDTLNKIFSGQEFKNIIYNMIEKQKPTLNRTPTK